MRCRNGIAAPNGPNLNNVQAIVTGRFGHSAFGHSGHSPFSQRLEFIYIAHFITAQLASWPTESLSVGNSAAGSASESRNIYMLDDIVIVVGAL